MSAPQENAIGIPITVTVIDTLGAAIDLTDATVTKLIFKRPDGTIVEKVATIVQPPTLGKLQYVTLAGDLTPSGTWQCQAYVVKPTLDSRGRAGLFDVLANLA